MNKLYNIALEVPKEESVAGLEPEKVSIAEQLVSSP